MNKTESKEKKAVGSSKAGRIIKFILNSIINVLIVLILVVSITMAVFSLTSKANNGLSAIFGFSFQTVQSDSMKGGSPDGYDGGDFEQGDLIIGKTLDPAKDYEFEKGDIVTFKNTDTEGNEFFEVHRIIDVQKNSNGERVYQTQGDNRKMSEVPDQAKVSDYLHSYNFVSVFYEDDYHGAILKGWGKTLDSLKEPQNFFFFVLLPMIIFFLYAIVRVVINAMSYKKEKEDQKKEDAEKEKRDAVDAAVKAALAEKNGEDAKPADAPADMTPEQMEQFKQFLAFQKAQQAAETPAEVSSETPADEPTETPETTEE